MRNHDSGRSAALRLALAGLVLSGVSAWGQGVTGWAWVPATAVVNGLYSYNSSGGTNTASHLATGSYQVNFPGIGGAGGTVQVSGYGGSSHCNLKLFLQGPSNVEEVFVACYDTTGAAVDSGFTVLYYREPPGNPLSTRGDGYLYADQPTAAVNTPYTPATAYQWNARAETNSVTRLAQGKYLVDFPDIGDRAKAAWVTLYGSGSGFCELVPDFGTGEHFEVEVLCYDHSGAQADSPFTISVLDDDFGVGGNPATPWRAGAGGFGLSPTSNAGGAGSVQNPSTGTYIVTFDNLVPSNASVAIVTSAGVPPEFEDNYCTVQGWFPGASNGTAVYVNCYSPGGTLSNSPFVVLYLTNQPAITLSCSPSTGPTQQGVYYSTTCTAGGGSVPFSLTGTLPSGLFLQSTGPNTFTLSGIPRSSGNYSFTLTAQDSTKIGSTSLTLSGNLAAAPPLTMTCNPPTGPATSHVFYSTTCTAGGGVAPYTYSVPLAPPTGLTIHLPQTAGAVFGGELPAAGGSASPLTQGLHPEGLSRAADPTSFSISGTPTGTGAYNFSVTVTDSATPPNSVTVNFSGTIAPAQGLTFTCNPAVGPSKVGVAYSTTCTAAGGTGPYSFLLTGGTLPAGLGSAFSNTAPTFTISGTPTAAGPYNYGLTVTDSATPAASVAVSFSGSVASAQALAFSCNPSTLPTTVGVAYSTTCTASAGGPPYTFGVGGTLPAGLSSTKNSTSITISGTPTTAGPYSFSVFVSDATSINSIPFNGTLAPAAGALAFTCNPSTGPVTVGVAYSTTCTATGGTGAYTFSFASGTLPAGLQPSATGPATFTISGAPTTAGPYSYGLTVRDSGTPQNLVTVPFSGTIAAAGGLPLAFTCNPAAGPVTVGVAYSSTCTATGGTGAYSFSVTSGTLAAGLQPSATAGTYTISGTPTTAGPYSYSLTVKDSATPPNFVTVPFSGTLAAAGGSGLAFACNPATGPATVGVEAFTICTASGGTAPYNFSVTGGSLPPGFQPSSAPGRFTIDGTPTTAGPYLYGLTVKDSATPPNSVTVPFAGNIVSAGGTVPPLALSCAPATGPTTVGVVYVTTCTASGGLGGYTIALTGGPLPAGLSAAPPTNSLTISGTPTAGGQYSFAVTVQDSATPPNSVTATYSGAIASPATALTLSCTPAAGPTAVGVAYSTTCTASGGVGAYTFSATVGQIPAGLSATPAATSATISGTPTAAGPYSFGVTVKDSATPPNSVTVTISGTIAAAAASLSVNCNQPVGPAAAGTAYTVTCTAANGTAPFSWSISAGALPAGLTLSGGTAASTTITGNPTGSGNFTFTLSVSDSSAPVQTASVSVTGSVSAGGSFVVQNAASFQTGTVAADSIATLSGTGLATGTQIYDGSVETTLGGASVQVTDSKGAARPAQLFYASPAQINFLVPAGTANGQATVTVTSAAGVVTGTMNVVNIAPGIFTVSGGSPVPAAFYLRVTSSGQTQQELVFDPNTLAAVNIPRNPGDSIYLLLFGTGIRHTSGAVTATAGGQNIPVLGAVAQPQFAGLDQVNIGPLPNLISGQQSIFITVDGVLVNTIKVALQ